MGWVISGWALALVAGVPLGGLIGEVAGWREALAALALLAVVADGDGGAPAASGRRPAGGRGGRTRASACAPRWA